MLWVKLDARQYGSDPGVSKFPAQPQIGWQCPSVIVAAATTCGKTLSYSPADYSRGNMNTSRASEIRLISSTNAIQSRRQNSAYVSLE